MGYGHSVYECWVMLVYVVLFAILAYLENDRLEKNSKNSMSFRFMWTFKVLRVAFGEQTAGRTQVFEWFSWVQRLCDLCWRCWTFRTSSTSNTDENVHLVKELVLRTRRMISMKLLTCWESHLGEKFYLWDWFLHCDNASAFCTSSLHEFLTAQCHFTPTILTTFSTKWRLSFPKTTDSLKVKEIEWYHNSREVMGHICHISSTTFHIMLWAVV